ncbi:MAG: hypothetical protein ABI591_28430 [Kofleriaceae bacterium]
MAVVAGSAGYYFFKIYSPAQTKSNAQAGVDRWEARWKAARDCLLGPTPGSSKTSEALAIREMNPDPWNRGSCTPLIGKLSRGDEEDSGLKAVETAWLEVDRAATKAAGAFATHIMSSTVLEDDPLPAALDALDAARADLRAAADMPALAQSGTPLRAAQLVPLTDGAATIKEISVDTKPSAHGIIVFGKSSNGDRDVEIALHTGGAPVVAAATGVLRAVPDGSWGAAAAPDRLQVGTINADGVMQPLGEHKVAGAQIDAIVGTAASGELVYNTDKQLVVTHTTGTGTAMTVAADPPLASVGAQAALDVDGRVALVWRDDKQAHGRILHVGHDEAIVELGDNPIGATCLTTDRAWVSTGTGILAFGGAKPMVMRANPFYIMLGCTTDTALLRSLDPHKPFLICTDDCRTVNLPSGAPELSAATVVAGKLVAVASHNGVLGLWREGTAPVFFGLPDHADPVMAQEWPAMAMTDGKVIDILARGAKGFVVIRIPAN